jgi:hypothetical protein
VTALIEGGEVIERIKLIITRRILSSIDDLWRWCDLRSGFNAMVGKTLAVFPGQGSQFVGIMFKARKTLDGQSDGRRKQERLRARSWTRSCT